MKRLYRINWALVILGFVISVVFLVLSPDTVPVHYNFAGEMDRMGSKYELLLLPASTLLSVVLMLLGAKASGKSGGESAALGEKICLWSAIGISVLFTGMEAYFMWLALSYTEGAAPSVPTLPAVDWMRLTAVVLGVLLIVLGNFMPKARMNQFYGVRTKWSMSSEEAWRKSQRFGGFASVAAGAVQLACGVLLKDWAANLAVMCVVMPVWLGSCVWASRRYGGKL